MEVKMKMLKFGRGVGNSQFSETAGLSHIASLQCSVAHFSLELSVSWDLRSCLDLSFTNRPMGSRPNLKFKGAKSTYTEVNMLRSGRGVGDSQSSETAGLSEGSMDCFHATFPTPVSLLPDPWALTPLHNLLFLP